MNKCKNKAKITVCMSYTYLVIFIKKLQNMFEPSGHLAIHTKHFNFVVFEGFVLEVLSSDGVDNMVAFA